MSEHIDIDHELITIRHYLHAHPERSFREFGTSIYLTDQLKAHGIEILHNPLETGVVGLIQGEAGPGPRIGLRADIDGLPIVEDSGLEFSSVNEGVMHGCGHDLHMTGLLGAAFWLAEHRDKFAGSIKILFQPSEETGQGARAMIDAGLVDDVEAIIGTHNNPNYAPGQLAIGVEPMMAGCVKFRVTLHAQGTHAGYPYKGTGPIEALASIILSLQTIVSRNLSPLQAGVVSICNIQAGHGTTNNVCPDEAQMYGTVRTYSQENKHFMDKRIHEITENIAAAYNTKADVKYIYELPVTDNTRRPGWPDLLSVANAAVTGAGAKPVDPEPSGGGEDFPIFVEGFDGHPGVPGFFYWLGVRHEETDCVYSWHSPHFKADRECIPIGAGVYALSALEGCRALSK